MSRLFPSLVLIAACSSLTGEAAVRHVEPSNPAAQDAGDGDQKRPYRTLGYAVKNLKPGDTLNIAAGTYRDSLLLSEIDWSKGGPTVIQSVAGAEVVIKGSDAVTGWERIETGVFVKRGWTVNSQQVFIDGKPLQQIGGTVFGGYPEKPGHSMAKLHAGQGQGGIWPGRVPGGVQDLKEMSFHYDAAAQSLYIKAPFDSLDGRAVEVSVRPRLVMGRKVENITLRNLRFQHANTTALNQNGAVTLLGNRLVLERIEVTHVDGNGFDITGDENTIRDSVANYCGQVGMKVRGRANKLSGNETSFNNTRGFNKWWEAGGAKFVGDGGLRDSEVRGHRAVGNNGDGIWFDWMNSNNQVFDSIAAHNSGFGIHYEASQKGYIYNNYVFGNKQRGIYLPHSSETVVAHNLIAGNGMEGVAIIDEGRSRTKSELVPRGNRVIGNIIGWNGKAAVVLPTGMLDSVSNYNLFLSGKEPPTFSVGWGSRESPLRKGLGDWKTASGQDAHSWSETLEVPGELREALAAKQTDPRWEPVMKNAARFRVRVADVGVLGLPGVAGSAPPGPRQ